VLFAGRLWPVGASRRRAAAAGAILYYVRSTQRGTLSHVDRIGFYERQTCLVLDAVTVRNLELIEPLFAGAEQALRCFVRLTDGHAHGQTAASLVAAAPVDRNRRDQRSSWMRLNRR